MNIDVRSSGEFAADPRDNCHNLPLDQLVAGNFGVLVDVPRDTSVVVWCRSGARAAAAVEILKSIGFTDVTNGHI